MKVLATGATGQFAHHIVPALTQRGIEVRALVRDPSKAEAVRELGADEVVQADLADPSSLIDALDGVDGAFLITPAFHPDAGQLGLNLIKAASDAGVGKVVHSSIYHPSLSLAHHAAIRPIEEGLYISDLDFTILEPAMYMQTLDVPYRRALETGALVGPWSQHSKLSLVDYRDVAEAAAIAFVDPRLSFGTFELAAGGMIDRAEIAELMSKVAGRTLVAAEPPQPLQGIPDGLAAMFDHYDRHGFRGGNGLVLGTILEREPRNVADYITELRRNAASA